MEKHDLDLICSSEKRGRRNKYKSIPRVVENVHFGSRAERSYYKELKKKQSYRLIEYFLRQVPFNLSGEIIYRCDFVIFCKGGSVLYVDVKGRDTKLSLLKRKQVEELYPIKITVVENV